MLTGPGIAIGSGPDWQVGPPCPGG
jgi:hypothetical protein